MMMIIGVVVVPYHTARTTMASLRRLVILFIMAVSGVDTFSKTPQRRTLPDRLLIGYTSSHNLTQVETAVQQGVNVIIWAFLDIVATDGGGFQAAIIRTHFDLTAVKECIQKLDRQGWPHVVHLASFGGWNGPHLDSRLTAEEWYHGGFKKHLGDTFHGLDWDIEGHDDLTSANNEFSMDCLDKMVAISQMAHADGYIVGMAPPQSYLDISHDRFSRRVNLTDPHRAWHQKFSYFGENVYAYILAQCSQAIDFISIQFYESYSRAAMYVALQPDSDPDDTVTNYLVFYVQALAARNFTHQVDFSSDDLLGTAAVATEFPIPLNKLVFGLANGWASYNREKVFCVSPQQVQVAWQRLAAQNLAPRKK